MKEINTYLTEKLHLDKNINVQDEDDGRINYIYKYAYNFLSSAYHTKKGFKLNIYKKRKNIITLSYEVNDKFWFSKNVGNTNLWDDLWDNSKEFEIKSMVKINGGTATPSMTHLVEFEIFLNELD